MTTSEEIKAECFALCAMLLEKNRQYGDSALSPVRVFSRDDTIEQINVRIDDKLSRIKSGQEDDDEDAEKDLIGYLVLKRIARRRTCKESLTVDSPFPQDGDDDPFVVHVDLAPDRTSRSTMPEHCLGNLCGRVRG